MLIGASNGGKGLCLKPTAEAQQRCTTEGGPSVTVDVTNPDDDDAANVDILKDGVVVFDNVPVPVGDTIHRSVGFAVNETATIKVVDAVWGEIFSQEFVFDCVHPNATIAHTCSADTTGTTVAFTNPGAESSAD